MQTSLSETARQLRGVDIAEGALRKCVHCGFCNATCPTYQLLAEESDGPRGRIYLIKQMLEEGRAGASTREHLDRCLSCRNCETTCPSGVEYHQLLDFGRATLERWSPRTAGERLQRWLLRKAFVRPRVFALLVALARGGRWLLPARLQGRLPPPPVRPQARPGRRHARQMLLLEGCVQPVLSPATNAAATRVLDRLGISVRPAAQAGCCGALDFHLDAQDDGLARARRNIDAWWPAIEEGAEAIVITASGCGAFVKEYGFLLRDDPRYAARAARVSALARDLVEVLRAEPLEQLRPQVRERLAFHCPCTLQHAQKLGGAVETVLEALGFELSTVPDSHLCCGAAGTYAFTQPELAERLRSQKLAALRSGQPERIVTANIGCQVHLESAGAAPVRHWIEVVDAALG